MKGYYQTIKQALNDTTEAFANEAENHLGKEFNTANGFRLQGKRQGLKQALQVLSDNGIYTYD